MGGQETARFARAMPTVKQQPHVVGIGSKQARTNKSSKYNNYKSSRNFAIVNAQKLADQIIVLYQLVIVKTCNANEFIN